MPPLSEAQLYARFASVAYGDPEHLAELTEAGWRRGPAAGKAVVLRRGADVVVAFRGTVIGDGEDAADDLALFNGTEADRPRFRRAVVLARKAVRLWYRKRRVTLAGHSLGGSLALHCAYAVPRVAWAHAFNPYASVAMRGNPVSRAHSYARATMYIVLDDALDATALLLHGPRRVEKLAFATWNPHALAHWL